MNEPVKIISWRQRVGVYRMLRGRYFRYSWWKAAWFAVRAEEIRAVEAEL